MPQLTAKTKLSNFNFQMNLSFSREVVLQHLRVSLFLTFGLEKKISKGCVYHLIRVQDSSSKIPTLEPVSVVCEFPDVFPKDLSEFPPKREINFGINLLPNTQSISILR